MGQIVKNNLPCPACGSRDNRVRYEDGSSYCFGAGCNKSWQPNKIDDNGDPITGEGKYETGYKKTGKKMSNRKQELVDVVTDEYNCLADRDRGVFKAVAELYGVKSGIALDDEDDSPYVDKKFYPYNFDANNRPKGYKVRVLPKDFESEGCWGSNKGLFGQHLWSSGKRLVITEGEEDAMAIQSAYFKKYKSFYPVMSLRVSSSVNDIIEARDQLRCFDEVILWFDNDEAGKKATLAAAKAIGYDKVKIVTQAVGKDASDAWLGSDRDPKKVLSHIYDAVEYKPAGILTKSSLWQKLEEYNNIESVPYPDFMEGLNEKLKGMRFGEITLWTSGTGSGKSTLLREIALHLVQTTKDRIGIISLEESPAETARKLAGMVINKNPAAEDIPLDELKVGFDQLYTDDDDRVMILDHHGSISDGSIVDYLEYLCLKGCKYLFIDHITILASEGAGGLTGNEATDKIMNDLLRIAKKHEVWIGLISHLRKTSEGKSFEEGKLPSLDDIRGSGSIKQISMDIIAFARNVGAQHAADRNTVKTKVLKCRYTGLTGPSGSFEYDFQTGRLKQKNGDLEEDSDDIDFTTVQVPEKFKKELIIDERDPIHGF